MFNIIRIIRQIIKLIILILVHPLTFLIYYSSGFFPRDEKVIIFGCWEGKYFRGNSKLLYLYIKDNYDNIDAIWITKDYNLNDKLCVQGENSRELPAPAHCCYAVNHRK